MAIIKIKNLDASKLTSGSVALARLGNVPASNNASALTTGTLPNARLPDNISDAGTEGTKVASGTTAQRGSTAGQIRFNSTTGLAEYYTGTAFKSIDSPPTVSSLDVTEVDSQAGGNQTIVITGSGFSSGATVTYLGSNGTNFNASTVTVNSLTQITVVAPKASFLNAQEPYGVKVTNVSGLSNTLASQINVDTSPSWSTASGTLFTIQDNVSGTHATVSASDPDGDTVAYTETASVLSGQNLGLNSSTGAITGDPTDVGSSTTLNFDLRATAGGKNTTRNFNAIINPSPFSLRYLVVAGGGGGGSNSGNYENGAGGGAGGFLTATGLSISHGTNYTVTVGAGGVGTGAGSTGNGANSVFSTFTSIGGGGGSGGTNTTAGNGGSGGGGVAWGGTAGGSGTAGQGNAGGAGSTGEADTGGSGGGGGAGAVGTAGVMAVGGNGGNGLASDITGGGLYYAGGGGGWGNGSGYGSGGSGGGGSNGAAGGTNTGGGGAGQKNGNGGTGGSGIVILRYPNTKTLTIGAGLTHSTATVGSDKVTSFTAGTGSINF